jgi:ankyrin repeat protein
LLATLHFDSLKDKRTKNEFQRALKALPQGSGALTEAYDDAIGRIYQQRVNDRKWAQRIMSWIVHAVRPLRLDELRHALAIEEGDRRLEEDNLTDLNELVSLCAGLVILNHEGGTVHLVHYTTYDYLSKIEWVLAARDAVATSCVTYLLFETFAAGFCVSTEKFQQRIELNPLYTYVSANWGHHVRTAFVEEKDLVLDFLEKEDYVSACGQAILSSQALSYDIRELPRELTGMHLAAYFGLEKAIAVLLARNYNIESIDSYGQTPLFWAVLSKQTATAELLLSCGTDPNLIANTKLLLNNEYWWISTGFDMPLGCAVRMRSLEMVRILLQRGANPNIYPDDNMTALFQAAQNGDFEIIHLLLQHGADPNIHPYRGGTALCLAARDGNLEIIHLLLQHGADPNIHPYRGGTALCWAAARKKNLEIVNVLLQHGADPNFCPNSGTALCWAARNGHFEIINSLLQHGADPNICPNRGMIALCWAAARKENLEIVNVLLQHGDDPNFCPNSGTALCWAARNRNLEIINLLLQHGADPNISPGGDITALCWAAARKENLEIVNVLLQHGADPNVCPNRGGPALCWAIQDENIDIVKLLLKHNADPDLCPRGEESPLSWAEQYGSSDLVMLLRKHNAHPSF